MNPPSRTRVHLICGFLGVGKTTALRALAAKRPPDERWAILVNEVGMVDVDGALLSASTTRSGVQIETLPGGCICCTSQAPFREAVKDTLSVTQVDRLFIEPTGLASPGPLLRALKEEPLDALVEVGRVVTLVDPRRFLEPALRDHPVFEEQITSADVLVANRSDQVSAATLARFNEDATALTPKKSLIASAAFGDLELAWLDGAREGEVSHATHHVHAHPSAAPSEPVPDADGVVRWAHSDHLASTCGWVFPPEERFVAAILEGVLGILAMPGPLLVEGALRIKGLVRVEEGAVSLHASRDGVHIESLSECPDNRLEIIVSPGLEPPWGAIEAALVSATCPRVR